MFSEKKEISRIILRFYLTLRRYTYFYWRRGYTWPKKSKHLFFHEKGLQKIFEYSEILFGDPILCSNRFCSNLLSDCLFITIYSDENISLDNFVLPLLEHVCSRRVKLSEHINIYFTLCTSIACYFSSVFLS